MTHDLLSLERIAATRARIAPFLRVTPWLAVSPAQLGLRGLDCELVFKLELMQATGTFKARGALSVMQALSAEELRRGVTAVSAGNHAVAVAYAAQVLSTHARVVMLKTANPARIERARAYGAEVELAEDGAQAFARVRQIEATEGRFFVHPFEGPATVAGSATLGLEFFEQAGALDAVVVAIGGGGLAAGLATAYKQLAPNARVIGVEPEGADVMSRSLAAGRPLTAAANATIADSLAAPMTTPHTFAICQRLLDEVVLVTDQAIRSAMGVLLSELKLCVEPAAAAALAAVSGPLKERLAGMRRVGVIVCGSNIDRASFNALLL